MNEKERGDLKTWAKEREGGLHEEKERGHSDTTGGKRKEIMTFRAFRLLKTTKAAAAINESACKPAES